MINQVKNKVTTPPIDSLFELDEIKERLVVETSEDDDLLQAFIDSATDYAQQYTGIKFLNQSVTYYTDCLPASNKFLEIPSHNASAVTAISYIDPADAVQTEDLADYYIDTNAMSVKIKPISGWPTIRTEGFNNFTVVVTEGWATVDDVPDSIKQGVALLVGHYYRNRESTIIGTSALELPLGSKAHLDVYRNIYRKDYGGF